MAKRIAGKLFQTAEEAGVPPLTDEETAAYLARAAAHRARMAAVPESERVDLSERFHDDLSGTEYEGWTPEDDKK
ncbi:hypothetical protein OG874_34880 [Nocardia sp. NBC_00565]|uniref:hypothetical protein n=1 Tax=Nocardia sp. NBC_00565 TaxID=2975993 RepID=UPI002E819C82|nr:hypothetical protein [Nocardia sp. NBC_00565]WUC01890.1 hypothetical protein OG874_34880 [Nocardia sp. NBC_00565]